MGEYPTGYQINEDIAVWSVKSPEDPRTGDECTLKKNTVIHPWAVKTKSEFATLTGTVTYKASQEIDLDGMGEKIAAGEEFKQLSYLSEGICLYEVKGKEVEASCFASDYTQAEVVVASPFPTVEYFKTACKEGYEAWVPATHVANYLNSEVSYAEITDYGSVKEP